MRILIPSLFFLLFALPPVIRAQENHNFETAKALDIFNSLYRELDLYYVDTLHAEQTVGDAILYMLDRLDPYTEYYKEERTDELRTLTTGNYAGIGSPIRFHKSSDRCAFDTPYEGMPAHKAGIHSGDVLLKIEGRDVGVCGNQSPRVYSDSISRRLRGAPGTTVVLTVRRPGEKRPLTFRITRANIHQPSVPFHTLLPDGHTGYVYLSGYTENTARDLHRAVEALKAEGAQRLVLDLRDNGGGLMGEAVKVVNLFVPKNRLVLETKAKDPSLNSRVKTSDDPWDVEMPLAVLVNYGTASSAEITSGALQDYDRAVIVGRRTYGKGLVQAPRPLPYGAILKLTTSKYYIPSGRCVQAYDFKHRGSDGQPRHLPDSLSRTFHTAAGRPVKDGGGITPDVPVQLDSLPNLISELSTSEALFDYAVRYCNAHPQLADPATFALTDAEFADFQKFMAQSGFTYDSQTRQYLRQLRQLAEFEGYSTQTQAEFSALEAKLSHSLTEDLELWKKDVREVVETSIMGHRYGTRGVIAYGLRNDPDLQAALKVLDQPELYRRILKDGMKSARQQ